MRYEEFASSLLEDRDIRHSLLSTSLSAAEGALVSVSLNIPGPVKSPPAAERLFAEALSRLPAAFAAGRELHRRSGPAGPFSLWSAGVAPLRAKAVCVEIESAAPRARLLDLDVYSPAGVAVDRAALGLAARPCLLCDRPAHECARTSRHPVDLLVRAAHALLGDPGL
jgi:holo-ACP synthase CitX